MVEEATEKSEEEKEVSRFEIKEEPKIYSASVPCINTKFQSSQDGRKGKRRRFMEWFAMRDPYFNIYFTLTF